MSTAARASHSVRRRKAFTLLEMMITVSVFILLAASIFGIITGVLQGSSALQQNQNRRDQVSSLDTFLTQKLGKLSAQGTLISYRRNTSEGLEQNGIIFGEYNGLIALDAKIQPNGYYLLRLAYAPPPATPTDAPTSQVTPFIDLVKQDDPTLNWIPMIHDAKTVQWKFRDVNVPDWVVQWNGATPGVKPALIEFTMQLAGDLQPVTMDFWLPHIEPVVLSEPEPATNNAP